MSEGVLVCLLTSLSGRNDVAILTDNTNRKKCDGYVCGLAKPDLVLKWASCIPVIAKFINCNSFRLSKAGKITFRYIVN